MSTVKVKFESENGKMLTANIDQSNFGTASMECFKRENGKKTEKVGVYTGSSKQVYERLDLAVSLGEFEKALSLCNQSDRDAEADTGRLIQVDIDSSLIECKTLGDCGSCSNISEILDIKNTSLIECKQEKEHKRYEVSDKIMYLAIGVALGLAVALVTVYVGLGV